MGASVERAKSWDAGRWVLIVLLVGLVVGLVLALVAPTPPAPGPPGPGGGGPGGPGQGSPSSSRPTLVLSTVSLALLVALLVVYGRTYRTTRAPYVLGLVLFLFVLLVQGILSSPLVFSAVGVGPGSGLGRLLEVAQFLMCAALALFLYLSLQ
jgi:uncharacterized membrane protein YedE/YeeE